MADKPVKEMSDYAIKNMAVINDLEDISAPAEDIEDAIDDAETQVAEKTYNLTVKLDKEEMEIFKYYKKEIAKTYAGFTDERIIQNLIREGLRLAEIDSLII